ncbi:hypothetical protein ES703_75079 [subsurface metagenome]
MGFTLGVKNAPASATEWMAACNYYSTGVPSMTAPLPLDQRWNCLDPAPGKNWLGVVCFDAEGNIVQESAVEVTIEDGGDYIFDFAAEAPAVSFLPLVMMGGLGVLGIGVALAFAMAKPAARRA